MHLIVTQLLSPFLKPTLSMFHDSEAFGAASRLGFEISAISDMQSIEMRSILFTLFGRIIQTHF